MTNPTRIYTARKIITMHPEQPFATAVAVRDGRILAVGELEDLVFHIENSPFTKVLMPGLVDAHTHLEIQALIYSGHFVAQIPWPKPEGGFYPIYPRKQDVLDRLKALDRELPPGELLYGAAYDENKTGEFLHVKDLDKISTQRPILISNLVFHRFWANTYLLQKAGIGPDNIPPGVETGTDGQPNGTLLEAKGLFPVLSVIPDLVNITEDKINRILPLFTAAGNTTVCEATLGAFGLPASVDLFQRLFSRPNVKLRVIGLPFVSMMFQMLGSMEAVLAQIEECRPEPIDKFRLGAAKLYSDGSIISRTSHIGWPGYWDGSPEGHWQCEPPLLKEMLIQCHTAGFSTITHANSRAGVQAMLDGVAEAQARCYRPDMRHRVDHAYNMTTAQLRKAKNLGVAVQFFTPQIYYYGDAHLKLQGPDRAHQMMPTGSARRLGVSWGFHNDPPGTPQLPWVGIWSTVQRRTESGTVLGQGQRVSVEDALRAATIEHAYQLHLDHEVGSIEFGKKADFCVLEENPLEIDPMALKDMPVWGTVFAGEPNPAG
ncbi:MAG: amidohydrolase [Deltaproteobacteria bacterium]|nr:amidohydrolase [Deltaproteobacteria bacterium]